MKKPILNRWLLFLICIGLTASYAWAESWIFSSKSNRLPDNFIDRIEQAGGRLVNAWSFIGIAVAEFEDGQNALSLATQDIQVMPDLEFNWIPDDEGFSIQGLGDDETYYGWQWYLRTIEADKVWDEGITGAGVRVAVLDTGIWYTHPDLAVNVDHNSSATFVPGTTDYLDDRGHGTHVAGIIAGADNGSGIIGIAPEATLIAVKVLDSTGSGSFSWIIAGIIHAVQVQADIINMSLKAIYLKDDRYAALLMATMNKLMNLAAAHGVLVVASAGNEGFNLNHSWNYTLIPAESGNCIAVSATGPTDEPAYYTNHGTSLVWVAAPGGDFRFGVLGGILSTWYTPPGQGGNWYSFGEGTSYAAPCVAGAAALVIQEYGRMNIGLLKNILANAADDLGKPGVDHFYGRGRINAHQAVHIKR